MSALTPRPGIMKIAPYVPGKDSVEGKKTIAKLSSNEGALGPSPKAMAAEFHISTQAALSACGSACPPHCSGAASPFQPACAQAR